MAVDRLPKVLIYISFLHYNFNGSNSDGLINWAG